ncbi:hypothetical protein STCU_09969 [Strigomonas culicis]|uniref:Uncharacterized protein n=1 Tax=Strigomonas culicis TaxID=28005 RepID=S9TJW8_9TRYP|nr:hypothetical protein STCU_09969 [Strigomonas culicis]|eukprot:EPY18452.1 hypothetical protein STCU_09969 [Strigomonas culicis]
MYKKKTLPIFVLRFILKEISFFIFLYYSSVEVYHLQLRYFSSPFFFINKKNYIFYRTSFFFYPLLVRYTFPFKIKNRRTR